VSFEGSTLIDWNVFARARTELGAGFIRILGYFREDGVKSLAAIEEAAQAQNAAAMVIPAHTLKGESLQFGAEPLAATGPRSSRDQRAAISSASVVAGAPGRAAVAGSSGRAKVAATKCRSASASPGASRA